MGLSMTNINPRSLAARLIGLGAMITIMLALYTYSSQSYFKFSMPTIGVFEQRVRSTCSPEAWNEGQWEHHPHTNLTAMTKKEDALEFAGWESCAGDREFFWHLGSDREDLWDRWPSVSSWIWKPKENCVMPPLDGAAMVKDMVEQGGWLMLGDSITEGHFFSMTCILYPHVRATPNYTENPYFDRAWPQHLYLHPNSSLIPKLALPKGFSIEKTPLVTFRRVDLLLEKQELIDLHKEIYNPDENTTLFSDEGFWSLSPKEYMPLFTAPLPEANYATLVASTAGHWTTTVLQAFHDESKKDSGYGIEGVLKFFNEAMAKWANDVQQALYTDQRAGNGGHKTPRRVVVRAYLPGHEDCHDHRAPWTSVQPFKWNWYNWSWITDYNKIFQDLLSSPAYPDIHYLPIDNPARLRPDAHASGDCLHIMTGSGVMEGWSHYIWHFVTRELGARVR